MPLPFLIGGIAALVSTVGAAGAAVAGTAAAVGTAAVGAATAAGATVVGAATAVGTAAAGAAAAAGTAVASTAVGGAVIGAATTAGTAIAGSAVGTAAVTAMGAVGGAVGTVAAAASSAPVIGAAAGTIASMTGTAAGAAAIGTIATTGTIGAANGVAGAAKLSKASDIKDAAMSNYRAARNSLEQAQDKTNSVLKSLGEDKLTIWDSFNRFSEMYSKIQNPPTMAGTVEKESLTMTPDELDQVRAVAISAKDMLKSGIAGVAAGNLIGLAASGGLISTISVASTGTAISALSGAAATNATMAALGGGTLAAHGAGVAGGLAVMNGLTIAPMLMVGGIMLNGKANKALENAKDIEHEADAAIHKMKDAETELKKVYRLSLKVQTELNILRKIYSGLMDRMEMTVARKTDYRLFSYEEKRTLEKTVLSLKLLKRLSMQNILDPKKENTILEAEVNRTLTHVVTAREDALAS